MAAPSAPSKNSGFTIVEMLITLTIIIILGVVTVVNLQGGKNSNDVTDTTKGIVTLLRQAQSDSMSQEQGATWGVYFSNVTNTAPFYALFINSYSTSTVQGGLYRLSALVGYVSSSLASGATTSVTFSQITGVASASTSIQLYLLAQPALSSSIQITSSGAVIF